MRIRDREQLSWAGRGRNLAATVVVVLAGGSSGVNNILTALGFRSQKRGCPSRCLSAAPRRRALTALGIATLAVLLAGCPKKEPALLAVSVPVQSEILEYAWDDREDALDGAVCLLRTPIQKRGECQDGSASQVCPEAESEVALRERLKPVFTSLEDLQLDDPSTTTARLTLIDNAETTDRVLDARRVVACDDWVTPCDAPPVACGKCAAVKVDRVWILLHAPIRASGAPERLEVFVAEPRTGSERICQ